MVKRRGNVTSTTRCVDETRYTRLPTTFTVYLIASSVCFDFPYLWQVPAGPTHNPRDRASMQHRNLSQSLNYPFRRPPHYLSPICHPSPFVFKILVADFKILFRQIARSLVTLVIVLWSASCSTWNAHPHPPCAVVHERLTDKRSELSVGRGKEGREGTSVVEARARLARSACGQISNYSCCA